MKVGLEVNLNKMQNRRGSRPHKTSDIGEELTEGKLFIKRVWRNGRRMGLKIPGAQARASSSLATRILPCELYRLNSHLLNENWRSFQGIQVPASILVFTYESFWMLQKKERQY